MAPKLGILAGRGALPRRLIERCREQGRDVFVLAFLDEADPETVIGVDHAWVRLGAAAEGFARLRAAGVGELVMAGGIRRPTLAALQPDWRAARLFARIGLKALGDDGLLSAVIQELEEEGFRLIGADEILTDQLAPEGLLGEIAPDAQAQADIAHGFRIIAGLGALDIGQAVVVQQGLVLGVEAIEGTDRLLARAGELRREGPGGVLIKGRKPGQERRADLPTIGPETVKRAGAAGLRGIAVETGGTLVLEADRVTELANELGLFVAGCRPGAIDAPLVFLIAGEPSGDALGARLMAALRERLGGTVRFAGIGGAQMTGQGLESLVPIADLAIMGVFEVLPAARRIFRRIRETVTAIRAARPAVVVTIDSSGFCFRVAERLREGGEHPLIVHYVAPMVWAWREGKARKAARAADHLLTLFPFEPPPFEKAGLPTSFVGHPVIESGADRGDGAAFRHAHGVDPLTPILTVLPGSRRAEVRALLPVFTQTLALLAARFPDLVVVVPTVETVADPVAAVAATWPVRTIILRGSVEKYDAFAASTVALAASGTVTLELAMAGLPMVVTYRIWPVTAWLIRRAVKVRWANLVNILCDREVAPEFLQERCRPELLAAAVVTLFEDERARAAQRTGFDQVLVQLGRGGSRPSLRAADKILALLGLNPVDPPLKVSPHS